MSIQQLRAVGINVDTNYDAQIDVDGRADSYVLDADGDTTISAPTDDQIDIEVAGADDFSITANSFNVLSGSAIDMADSCQIKFGDADDITMAWDGTDFDILQAGTDSSIKVGIDGAGMDLVLYGDTAGSNCTWDQSADSLILTDSTPIVFGDSSDCNIQFDGTQMVITPAAAGGNLHVGDASDTTGNVIHVFDGGAEKPGALALYGGDGTVRYLWIDTTGDVRTHTAYPTDEDMDGTIVGTQT